MEILNKMLYLTRSISSSSIEFLRVYTSLYFRIFLKTIMKYYLNPGAMYYRTPRAGEKKDDFYYYPITMKHGNCAAYTDPFI